MIRQPLALIAILIGMEAGILFLADHPRSKKYFRFLPAVFWIYFLPMLASTAGLIDAKSPLYQKITEHVLPASLFLLLIPVDLKAILRLGAPALIMFLAGSAGIVLGAPIVFVIVKNFIGGQFWTGFGALCASWTGGSANMVAVKEALGTPDEVFLPMVVVDTVVPYLWMGGLIALAAWQPVFDRLNRSDRRVLDSLASRISPSVKRKTAGSLKTVIGLILAASLAGWVSRSLAAVLPVIPQVISTYAWSIIVVTFLGLLFSLTNIRGQERQAATPIGYALLYFVLTSIGAKASLSQSGSTVILILAGFGIVFIHTIFLLVTARLIKAPMFLVATASQANVGGVASAPVVAEIYQPGLAPVGLLLAILGNMIGTYLGILAGQLCRLVGGV